MCPSKLLALFSALPITMVIAGPDRRQDELISQKNNLPTEQPVRSIATFMRNIRRENPCFTTISTLAIAFVMGFLIMRCFIAISSSRKNEGLLVSRRLASRFDNMCSEEEEGRTFLDMAKDRATWRKLLKPAIFLGAGAIIGAAMSAGITAGIMKQEKNQLQLQLDHLDHLGILPPLPATVLTKVTLLNQLPQNVQVTMQKRKYNFAVTKINERLVNCFVTLTASGKDADATEMLTNFANYLITKAAAEKDAESATELADELETKYKEIIKKILAMDIKEIEDAKEIFEKAKEEIETAKEALKKKLPKHNELMTPIKSGGRKGIEATDLNEYVLNYYLSLLGTRGKGPNADDIVDELDSFAASYIRNTLAHLRDSEVESEAENIAIALQSQYKNNITAMVEDKDVATEFKKTAFKKVAISKCASYYYTNLAKNFVTPTVAKTVKDIKAGTKFN